MPKTATSLSRSDVEDVLEAANLWDATIRDTYSGRGMSGDACFGIVHDSDSDMLVFAVHAGDLLGVETAEELVRSARTDNMGNQVITYFPRFALSEKDGGNRE